IVGSGKDSPSGFRSKSSMRSGQRIFLTIKCQACRHEIAHFREIETPESWRRRDAQTRYGQSACAVHYMAVQDGVPAIIEYFRLFKDRFDAAQNFVTAFGKSTDTFEQELRAQVRSTRDFIPFN